MDYYTTTEHRTTKYKLLVPKQATSLLTDYQTRRLTFCLSTLRLFTLEWKANLCKRKLFFDKCKLAALNS